MDYFLFADPTQEARFPKHGWANNQTGFKVLRLPILRLAASANRIRAQHGLNPLTQSQFYEIQTFQEKTRQFVLALRELHKCIRIGSVPITAIDSTAHPGGLRVDIHSGDESERAMLSHEMGLLLPLYLHLAYDNLRSIADHSVRAVRHVLFKHGAMDFRPFRDNVLDSRKAQSMQPLCDTAILQEEFSSHSGWFDELRDFENPGSKKRKGIRDIIEHHGAIQHIYRQENSGPWEIEAFVGDPHNPDSFRTNLIPKLRELIEDACKLWAGICKAGALPVAERPWIAPYGDGVLVTGEDSDATGFWPEI